jgi:hypothetical protein
VAIERAVLKTVGHLGLDVSSIIPADGETIREQDVLDHIKAQVKGGGGPGGPVGSLGDRPVVVAGSRGDVRATG